MMQMRDAGEGSSLEEGSNWVGAGSLRRDRKALCRRPGSCMDGRDGNSRGLDRRTGLCEVSRKQCGRLEKEDLAWRLSESG